MPDTFFLITGMVLTAIGVSFFAAEALKALSCSRKATARIVRLVRDSTRHWKGTFPHYPVVAFEAEGREYTVKARTYTRRSTKYKIGQEVSIRYNPENPKELRLGVGLQNYIAGAVSAVLGITLIAVYFI